MSQVTNCDVDSIFHLYVLCKSCFWALDCLVANIKTEIWRWPVLQIKCLLSFFFHVKIVRLCICWADASTLAAEGAHCDWQQTGRLCLVWNGILNPKSWRFLLRWSVPFQNTFCSQLRVIVSRIVVYVSVSVWKQIRVRIKEHSVLTAMLLDDRTV